MSSVSSGDGTDEVQVDIDSYEDAAESSSSQALREVLQSQQQEEASPADSCSTTTSQFLLPSPELPPFWITVAAFVSMHALEYSTKDQHFAALWHFLMKLSPFDELSCAISAGVCPSAKWHVVLDGSLHLP